MNNKGILKNKDMDVKSHTEKDCTNCFYFQCDALSYPSGQCKKYSIGCGVGYYCDKFIQNKRLLY